MKSLLNIIEELSNQDSEHMWLSRRHLLDVLSDWLLPCSSYHSKNIVMDRLTDFGFSDFVQQYYFSERINRVT